MARQFGQGENRYVLGDKIGEGGMGAVYRARQEALDRDVAIKVITEAISTHASVRDRFNREARTAARLEHPNIVPIYDYGISDGKLYVVMRLLTGGTLGERIESAFRRKQPPTLAEVAKMLTQIASALDYAHSQNVIHRDIKPANILFDDKGNAYLVDFGIARVNDARESTNLTSTGALVGSPSYMSPEQWRSDPLTPASDQYSLGVVVYLMLCGHPPFAADNAPGLMYKHMGETPSLLNYRKDLVGSGVERAVLRALAKAPGDRFEKVSAFADAFRMGISGQQMTESGFFERDLTQPKRPAGLGKRPTVERSTAGAGVSTVKEKSSGFDAISQTMEKQRGG